MKIIIQNDTNPEFLVKIGKKRKYTEKMNDEQEHRAEPEVEIFTTPPKKSSQLKAEETPTPSSRTIGSLVLLTQRVVNLMKENGGYIDLKKATELLGVQKRRIYDITNVLEGVGLIEKTRHSSMVRWRGEFSSVEERESLKYVIDRYKELDAIEADLDKQLDNARRNLKYVMEDSVNNSYAYVTRDDLRSVFGDDVIFVVPKHDDEVKVETTNDTFFVSLDNGGTIDVRLVTDQGKCHATIPKHIQEAVTATDDKFSRLQSPSPTSSADSSSNLTPINSERTAKTRSDLVTHEHTYYYNPELKEEMEAIEKELTAQIVFQSYTGGHSMRRFFPDDPCLDNPPLLPLNPPHDDYNFVLSQDEGLCELFDIQCT